MSDSVDNSHCTFGIWSLLRTPAGAIGVPEHLTQPQPQWIANVPVPGTVAQALQAAGQWDYRSTLDLDVFDWWYHCPFQYHPMGSQAQVLLRFGGLATLAEVWLNGYKILLSDNMHLCHEQEVGKLLLPKNELIICFRSLDAALKVRRLRPRWKTRLVGNQQLRWIRTTLLGRMLGISPIVAPVGPWRSIELVEWQPGTLIEPRLDATLIDSNGVVNFSAKLYTGAQGPVTGMLSIGDVNTVLDITHDDSSQRVSCCVRIPNVKMWWPHTHGEPHLYACTATITFNGRSDTINLGRVGFRRIEVDEHNGRFALQVNGKPVFCRGACWTVNNIVSLGATARELEETLRLLQQAGGNMVKIGGTMVYEDANFYRLCDELGILIWQEFMFSNMDYPFGDEHFRNSVLREVHQQLHRWRSHPCIAVYCGNSDVELQASMVGVPRTEWRNSFFAETLPALIASEHPGIPYVPSSPSGGDMPFHVGSGVAHYYAVSAFMQPVSRVRGDNVQFASECLGFAHIPEPDVINEIFGGDLPMLLDPRWKQRVARNHGFNYDFDDVRDTYLQQLFSVEARALRIRDTERYLALSRVVPGEVLSRVYAEWRRPASTCRGALIWFLKDFWPGAGLGILDSHGHPKASYYFLRRAWQARTLVLTDEGFDGVHLHLINESITPLAGTVELTLLRDGKTVIAQGRCECTLAPGTTFSIGSDVLLDGFFDVAYVYRIGPPHHDVVVGTLLDAAGQVLAQAYYFPLPQEPARAEGVMVSVQARPELDGYRLTLTTDRFLFAVRIDSPGYVPEDNYLHLAPGYPRTVLCRPTTPNAAPIKGYVEALNLDEAVRIQVIPA